VTAARPAFRKFVVEMDKGTVLIPLLHSYLFDAKFPKDFSVDFHYHSMHRAPDGWFHPSTHPIWPARKLWLHCRYPEATILTSKEYMGTLSVTMGTAVHSFIQMCLDDMGVLEAAEVPAVDDELHSRGSMDGVLKLPAGPFGGINRQLLEFKTSNLAKLGRLKSLDLEAFKNTWPEYYLQVQEYMRVSGLRVAVVLFMALGYPWELREFHVPYDERIAASLKEKYRIALGPDLPQPCCAPGSSVAASCPMRTVCPVAGGVLPS